MSDFKSIKDKSMKLISDKFKISKREMDFKEKFYYPRWFHLLQFNLEQYEIKRLGNLAILQGKGVGVMRMLTLVFTPNDNKEIPFVIVDFIKIANKRTVFVELYTEHMTQKENLDSLEKSLKQLGAQYSGVENYTEKPNWYTPLRNVYSPLKQATAKEDELLEQRVLDYLEVYLESVDQTNSGRSSKNIQLEAFINDLIYKGNPSQAILEKAVGEAETKRLFKEIIFYYK